VVLPDGRMLLVANDVEQGREALSLLVSSDSGKTWQKVYQLEDQRNQSGKLDDYLRNNARLARNTDAHINDADAYAKSAQRNRCEAEHCGYEFSYPYLIQTHNGDFHLVYTWNRSFIKHVQFGRTWLDARMKESDATVH
jgi:hypothetical protein